LQQVDLFVASHPFFEVPVNKKDTQKRTEKLATNSQANIQLALHSEWHKIHRHLGASEQ